uniref:Uncharacterized protein n=1 Tax=Arundo donax TaxID=35708 RepID=A0A0A9DM52_ARUDO
MAHLLPIQHAPPRADAAAAVAVDDNVARLGQEEGPDVLPRRPPLHNLEPLGPRRLLGRAQLGGGGVSPLRRIRVRLPLLDPLHLRLHRQLVLLLQQPLHELQPWREVEREQVSLVEELVRRRRKGLLPVPGGGAAGRAGALELEAGRGGRLRRGDRGEVHVDVVVLDHHCGWPRHCCHANASFGGREERGLEFG